MITDANIEYKIFVELSKANKATYDLIKSHYIDIIDKKYEKIKL